MKFGMEAAERGETGGRMLDRGAYSLPGAKTPLWPALHRWPAMIKGCTKAGRHRGRWCSGKIIEPVRHGRPLLALGRSRPGGNQGLHRSLLAAFVKPLNGVRDEVTRKGKDNTPSPTRIPAAWNPRASSTNHAAIIGQALQSSTNLASSPAQFNLSSTAPSSYHHLHRRLVRPRRLAPDAPPEELTSPCRLSLPHSQCSKAGSLIDRKHAAAQQP